MHLYAPKQVTPFQQVFLDAAPAAGLPLVSDLNDWDEDAGIAPSPVNVVDGVRWNAAFAYLDPVRDRASVQVVGDATVVRVVLRGDRAVGVELLHDGRVHRVGCDRVVVTAGAYGSSARGYSSAPGSAILTSCAPPAWRFCMRFRAWVRTCTTTPR